MADAAAAPDDGAAAAPPQPWYERLQARVADVERSATALLAVCEEPETRAALQVRAHATHGRGAAGARVSCSRARVACGCAPVRC